MEIKNIKKYIPEISAVIIIIAGIFLRLKGWIINPSMWHDECNLGVSIIDFHIEDFFFKRLELGQVAPPLFMVGTKFLTNIFGISDRVLRVIPELCGIGSIILFYLVVKEYFKSNLAKLTALTVFVINSALIYYSSEFKQYGCDVFSVLLVIYIFNKVKFENLSVKKLLSIGIGLAVLSWFSFVSLLATAGGFCMLLLKRDTRKQGLITITPVAISLLVYAKLFLFKTYTDSFMVKNWAESFVTPTLSNFPTLFIDSLRFMFAPVKMLLFPLIFFICGIVYFIRERNQKSIILFLTIIFMIILSMMKIYPYADRVILFLVPIYLIFMFKIFDINKKVRWFLFGVALLTFLPQILINANYLTVKTINKKEPAKEFAKYMAESIQPNEIIYVNAASASEFKYYSYIYKIKNKVFYEAPETNMNSNRLEIIHNQLSKISGNVWFYMPFDIPHRAVTTEIAQFVNNKSHVLEQYNMGTSNLLHAKL